MSTGDLGKIKDAHDARFTSMLFAGEDTRQALHSYHQAGLLLCFPYTRRLWRFTPGGMTPRKYRFSPDRIVDREDSVVKKHNRRTRHEWWHFLERGERGGSRHDPAQPA